MPTPRGISIVLIAAAAGALVACGNDAGPAPDPRERFTPERVSEIRIGLADRIETIDPLFAGNRAERIAARQIYEPLVSRQREPFGGGRARPGIARSVTASDDLLVWTVRLRREVRFHDGTPINAQAVAANVDRWLAAAPGLLPAVAARDMPEPRMVRLILADPDPDVRRQLADRRLGLVAPAALERAAGAPVSGERTGGGPFELRERDGEGVLLARNNDWWGTRFGIGPWTNALLLRSVPSARERLRLLGRGELHVADALGGAAAEALGRDPLLTVTEEGIGLQRSVRGLRSLRAGRSLAGVWLTEIRQ